MKLWFIYRHGRFSCIDPRHWGHSEKIGRYPLLYPPPAPLGLGLHSAENLQSARHFHENGSDRDALEGGRELGGFSKRQAVIADMAKWGSGEASGAPEFPLAIDQIGIGGVRTIELDGLRGLFRLVRRSGVAHLRHDRTLVSWVLQLISGNPIILMGQKGREICLGMGSYQPRSVARPSDRGAALECFKC